MNGPNGAGSLFVSPTLGSGFCRSLGRLATAQGRPPARLLNVVALVVVAVVAVAATWANPRAPYRASARVRQPARHPRTSLLIDTLGQLEHCFLAGAEQQATICFCEYTRTHFQGDRPGRRVFPFSRSGCVAIPAIDPLDHLAHHQQTQRKATQRFSACQLALLDLKVALSLFLSRPKASSRLCPSKI